MQNYFDIFELEVDFNLDKKQLKQSFNQKIIEFHPDKFSDEKQKNSAVKNTSLINTAFKTLNDEVSRGTYILELNGINAFDENDTKMNPEFLMKMVELQEQLSSLNNEESIEDFVDKIEIKIKNVMQLATKFFTDNNLEEAKNIIRELKFYTQVKNRSIALLDNII